ncbi:type-F conjugative transfer system pilin assembly protein TraF [Legionella septentrionalis]|uniref:type-F conjugative transfer system pilin assembly protein TraF n=1 Tax=Legionella septentrionalis TaxID=2498109 RepID=UPI000F8CE917|nr:type-F conjugative transfer system pilin assembly protein TraF [Legionella septentrionalis]RUQ96658.1 type-F conjugative transfer system pilin assembly protein TraF [Legionella septentrionalis]
MMQIFSLILLLTSFSIQAEIIQHKASGFHWYTKEIVEHVKKKIELKSTVPEITPYEKLMKQRQETLNKLATALITPSFEATHEYMKAQMIYAKKNQEFVRFWQQVLLVHPELDHTLNFPTDNNAVAIRNDSMNLLMNRAIKESSKKYGLILFYRGNSSISQKFLTILMPFVKDNQFSMISVTTDGQPIAGLPNPKNIPLKTINKTMELKSRYMPALFLVNLENQKMSPLSYGLVSVTGLRERFLDVVTNFKRFSYEGIKE